jgi:hypothetical protein
MDAFLSNTACFLDTDEWKDTMRMAVYEDETLFEEAPIVLKLWGALVHAPVLFRETTNLVLAKRKPRREVINKVIGELSYNRDQLVRWLIVAQQMANAKGLELEHCTYGLNMAPTNSVTPSYMTHLSLRATYAVCRLIKARLLYALAPACFPHLEAECQDLSLKILDLKLDTTEQEVGGHAWKMFLTQGTWIAKGTVATADIWKRGAEDEDGMIEGCKLDAWCHDIGRKMRSAG